MISIIAEKSFLVSKTCKKMMRKSKAQAQRALFRPLISDFIDMKHDLLLLANHIDR